MIACKNAEKRIKMCLESLLKIDYPKDKLKIIVVDSSSNKQTFKVLTDFTRRHEFIRIYRKNLTISQGYNFALRLIGKNQIVAFTDADCVVKRDWLRKLVRHFDDPLVAAVGGFYETPKDVDTFPQLLGLELESRTLKFKKHVPRLPTGNITVRKIILEKIGGFDNDLTVHQDADLGYRIVRTGYKFVYDSEANVYHYHRSSPWSFFKQQFRYGLHAPELYFKHPKRLLGDHITSPLMNFEPLIYVAITAFFLLSRLLEILSLYYAGFGLLFMLLSLYVYRALKSFMWSRRRLSLFLPAVFLLRGLSWTFGLLTFPLYVVTMRAKA